MTPYILWMKIQYEHVLFPKIDSIKPFLCIIYIGYFVIPFYILGYM